MKKVKNFMAAIMAIALIGFVGCSDSTGEIDNQNTEEANAYLKFEIAITDNAGTKGAEDSGIPEAANSHENKISNLYLYFFNESDDKFVAKTVVPTASLSESGVGGVNSESIPVKFPSVPGTYRVIAVANEANTALEALTTANSMTNALASTIDAATLAWTSSATPSLVMASRTSNSETDEFYGSAPYVEFTIAAANTKDSPIAISMTMERTVAKLTFRAHNVGSTTANEYEIGTGDNECVVEIDGYRVVNLNNSGYVFRNTVKQNLADLGYGNIYDVAHTADLNGRPVYPTGGNPYIYVWDPISTDKKIDANNELDFTGFNTAYTNHVANIINDGASASFTATPTNTALYTLMGYCAENTAEWNAQRNGYSTGVIFRGKVKPTTVYDASGTTVSDLTTLTDFYYSTKSNKFYFNAAAVVADATTQFSNVSEITDAEARGLAFLEAMGLQKFIDGYCYYTYWVEHEKSTTKNQIMEFAIVRNNTYNMKIASLAKLGTSEIFIDPNDPNELTELFFTVELTIRPWIVRENDINF